MQLLIVCTQTHPQQEKFFQSSWKELFLQLRHGLEKRPVQVWRAARIQWWSKHLWKIPMKLSLWPRLACHRHKPPGWLTKFVRELKTCPCTQGTNVCNLDSEAKTALLPEGQPNEKAGDPSQSWLSLLSLGTAYIHERRVMGLLKPWRGWVGAV